MDSGMLGRRRWTSTSVLLVTLLLSACGGGDEPGDGRDGGPDATVDGGGDGSAPDGGTDAAVDGGDDGSATDGGPDAAVDGGGDGSVPDGGTDASPDGATIDADTGPRCTEDADCDDGNECNGRETCSAETRQCEDGTPLDDGTDCDDGAGSCFGGICGPRACTNDADCDDGNECNGLEICSEGRCAPGTPLDCDDGDACTADSCIPGSGCINVLIDADGDGQAPSTLGECGTDCDDSRAEVYEGAIEACDGLDNDCDGMTDEGTLVTWYADCDGDGFAAADATRVDYCSLPPIAMAGCVGGGGTWTTRPPEEGSTDCNDANPGVYPGREGWFDTPIPGVPAGVDFDYDCSGSEERRYGQRGRCYRRFRGCAVATGFLDEVPACGESAMVITACAWDGTNCVPSETEPLTQVCR